jgi:hypothetical protein
LCVAVTWGFYLGIIGAIGNYSGFLPSSPAWVIVSIIAAGAIAWLLGVRRAFGLAAFQAEKARQGKDFYVLFLLAYWLLRIIGYIPTLAMLNIVGYVLDIVYGVLTVLDMIIAFYIIKQNTHRSIASARSDVPAEAPVLQNA